MISPTRRRIAVLGLYNSGSTALAGMLHRLGVNMGAPFWRNSHEIDPENYYEPYDIARQMRKWWSEPLLIDHGSSAERVRFFRDWLQLQESKCAGPVGLKHPLLSLCIKELMTACGNDVRFVWCWREFDESVDGLNRRRWFDHRLVAPLQQRLWDRLVALEPAQVNLTKFSWDYVQSNPLDTAQQLAALAGIDATKEQLHAAAEFVHPPSVERSASQVCRSAA
ncbi:MAG TPA: hypothetical protein VGG19_19850 [Tepidisphaeraceae bacterium]|jgi:hypothetical protein